MPRLKGHAAAWKCGLSAARASHVSREARLLNVEKQFKNYEAKQKCMRIWPASHQLAIYNK